VGRAGIECSAAISLCKPLVRYPNFLKWDQANENPPLCATTAAGLECSKNEGHFAQYLGLNCCVNQRNPSMVLTTPRAAALVVKLPNDLTPTVICWGALFFIAMRGPA
jgi:hypothetical protein